MARVKRGTTSKKRHKRLLSLAKGYRGSRRKLVKVARETVLKSGQYAYHGRKLKKRDMRRLWITRINAAVKKEGYSYSAFIKELKVKKILLDRKILSNLVVEDPSTFSEIVKRVFKK